MFPMEGSVVRHPEGHVFQRRLSYDYPVVTHGEGVYLFDTEGRRYLDAAGGAVVVSIGHGVSEVVDALAEQARRVAFAHGTQFTSHALEAYAAALAQVSPIPDPRVYLVSGGSEAVETALKLARQVCLARADAGRYKIIARWGSYHGATLGALSASGRTLLRQPYAPLLIDIAHIPPAYCYRCPFGHTGPPCDLACADALEAEIQRQGSGTVAAFIAEPIVGATLVAAVPPPGYWQRVRDICDRHGVLLIADEVMTGFGRTGRWFAVEHEGVIPDILVGAKGASSGYYPLGVVLCSQGLVDQLKSGSGDFVHGFTYANGVLGAAAGLAVYRYMVRHDLVARSARMGDFLIDRLQALRGLPAVGEIRGRGLLVGIELVADSESRQPYPRAAHVAERVQAAAMARGLVVYYGTGLADGVAGDGILLGPPFVINEQQIDEVVRILREAISEVVT
jgi:adenosylmethionine-8-amino-7-oxononanoate aminotransferase